MASGYLIKYGRSKPPSPEERNPAPEDPPVYLAKDLYNDHYDWTDDISAALVVPEEYVYQLVDSFCQRRGQKKILMTPQDFDLLWVDDDSLLLNNTKDTSNEAEHHVHDQATDHRPGQGVDPLPNERTIRWIPTKEGNEEENPF